VKILQELFITQEVVAVVLVLVKVMDKALLLLAEMVAVGKEVVILLILQLLEPQTQAVAVAVLAGSVAQEKQVVQVSL
jgi:hypothetical protein